ncbi:MAG: hypothetical protein NTW86_32720, partial [Candidatus Sumerlaeota bacterium]|nr:hypothetical protein [Candidatus Sumerlaeota bacterium]
DDLHELRTMLGGDVLNVGSGRAAAPDLPGLGIALDDRVLEEFSESDHLPGVQDTVFKFSPRDD